MVCVVLGIVLYDQRKQFTKDYSIKCAELDAVRQQLQDSFQLLAEKDAAAAQKAASALAAQASEFDTLTSSFNNFIAVLDKNYEQIEREYEENVEFLENAYDTKQQLLSNSYEKEKLKIQQEKDNLTASLEALKSKMHATMEAARRQEEIKDQKAFYSISIDDIDLCDIEMLEKIKPRLNKPRVLSMLIWTTWFRAPMTNLCNNVLGTEKKTGIYKITNQIDNRCYIGQSLDIAERWKAHAKCGLDIDTPPGNKLYAAMREDGLQNFTWELLEECSRTDLNEREKFYIDLYDSKNFGYNGTQGNK